MDKSGRVRGRGSDEIKWVGGIVEVGVRGASEVVGVSGRSGRE